MPHLYDFGMSQEDPLTEFQVLQIQEYDHLLCVASGGEVPLTILCLQPGVKITAVDISETQLALCRLKLQAAIALPFPLNGQFLGYAHLDKRSRREIYFDKIHPHLTTEDQNFWQEHLTAIEKGVVNSGRFEGYIKRLRKIASLLIGNKNIRALLACNNIKEQQELFDASIANRRALKYLFRIAFHPVVYKKRGLSSRALMHAHKNTGELFFNKFRNFCTATPAKKNYFLQYFLLGTCTLNEAFPEYLRENSRSILSANRYNLNFKNALLQDELASSTSGSFTKIHLSNIGDWMSKEDFHFFLDTLNNTSNYKIILCYRFLQKNHFEHCSLDSGRFDITSVNSDLTDRFPFYSVLSIQGHG